HVIKQLSGIGSSLQIPTRHGRIMSLGDGLAKALKRYTRAKERHGLKALLLGDIDPTEIETEHAEGGSNGKGVRGKNGGGNGNGGSNVDKTILPGETPGDVSIARLSPRHSYRVKCPDCGGDLDMGEGCTKCHGCGYTHC
ncbi:MAG: hypothetical protein ACE5EC_07115, partial [Phycisphaerae bacterium]